MRRPIAPPPLRAALLTALAVASVPVAGCGVSQELYSARLNELTNLKAELDAERKAGADSAARAKQQLDDEANLNVTLRGKLRSLGQNVEDLEKSKVAIGSELEATRKERDDLRRQRELAEARATQFRQLFGKFRSMIDAGKLKVEIRNGLMLVKLADNILFDQGKTDLKPAGKEALKEVSTILAGFGGRKFQVAGHTDNLVPVRHGAFKSNWELSTARAVNVVHFLIDEGGMQPDRVSAAGFADQLPVAPNATPEGRQQNRRIEIVLMPNIEDLPNLDDVAREPAPPAGPSTSAPAPAPEAAPAR